VEVKVLEMGMRVEFEQKKLRSISFEGVRKRY
jgi:hypothetical protein